MNTQQLKQKILDLAIRGQLVPQDRGDEPASVLLEKIKAERETNTKKNKRDTTPYPKEEAPFDIPENWEWCRLEDIAQSNIGLTYKPENISENGFPVLRSNNVQNDRLFLEDLVRVKGDIQKKNYLDSGDLLICARNGSRKLLGKCAIINNLQEPMVFGAFMAVCRSRYNNWIFQILRTEYFQKYLDYSNSTTINQITQSMLLEFMLPLPPLDEQIRIVKKIEELFTIFNELEANKTDLKTLIKQTKSKVLDLAIRGELVTQNPADEPASVLLEKIKSEQKSLKKQKKISDDNGHYEEVPFENPKGWELMMMKDICELITDGTHQTPIYSEKGYIFLSSKNVTKGFIDWENVKYIGEDLHSKLYQRLAPKIDDILLAKNGTTGVAAIVDKDCVFDIYVSLAVLRPMKEIIVPKFLLYSIGSSYIKDQFNKSLKGIGVPNLHLEHIRNTFIPIPPHTEQAQIVEKIEAVFSALDQIEASLL